MKKYIYPLLSFSFILFCNLISNGQAPSNAAPTPPERSASKIISIFCGTYADVAGTNFGAYWNQSTEVSTVNIEQNPTLKFVNFNYQGFELGGDINALPMTHLHIDVWTSNETSFAISPVSHSQTNENVALSPIVKNTWNSYDIELASVAAKWKSVSDIYQFFLQGAGGHTVYIDNLYFYNNMEGEDNQAPAALSVAAGLVTFNSIEVVLNATDNSGAVFYELKLGDKLVNISSLSGKEASYTFNDLESTTNYSISVTAKDYTGNVTENSPLALNLATINMPEAAPVPPVRTANKVVSVYSDSYKNSLGTNFYAYWKQKTQVSEVEFNGNPVLKYDNFNYQGIELGVDINALPMTHLHIDVYTSNETSMGLYPVSRTKTNTKVALTPLALNTWNSFDIALEDVKSQWTSVADIFQFFLEGSGGKTVYIDNIYFYNNSELEDTVAPDQIIVNSGVVMFNSIQLLLKARDNSGAVVFDITDGTKTYQVAGISGYTKSFTIDFLEENTEYNFSISVTDPTGNEAANNPVSLTVKTLEAVSAPKPTIGSNNVISIFSNAYANVEGTNFNPFWSQSTIFSNDFIGNDEFLIYSNLNYQGIEFGKHVDVSKMKYLHLDVWTPNENKLEVTVISPGKEKLISLSPLVRNTWNSYDIPLLSFTGVNMKDLFQFKFVGSGGKVVYLDNFYFHDVELSTNAISLEKDNIQIYPNLVCDIFRIDSEVEIQEIQIYNQFGQLVKNEVLKARPYWVDVNLIPSGTYIVAIETIDGKILHKKLIKR